MLINGEHRHTIWHKEEGWVQVYDQRYFPHDIRVFDVKSSDDAYFIIREMVVRGAPLIGVAAAYGLYLAACEKEDYTYLLEKAKHLGTSRPTAVNLQWALDKMLEGLQNSRQLKKDALSLANEIKQIEIDTCSAIGDFGVEIIEEISRKKKGETVNILTHCNAGWLACIDWGTATAPVYKAVEKGIDVHVWVDETRPRNQGANLTAFELGQQGVKHTLIVDNTGGHLMQHGMVDMVITGTDRTTRSGDVANKIGTYLKALAAHDNDVPFYVALPSSTIDWAISDGVKEIPIETRSEDEVKYMQGQSSEGKLEHVLIAPKDTPALNYGFDVTPAKYVSRLITEKGICEASEEALSNLFNR